MVLLLDAANAAQQLGNGDPLTNWQDASGQGYEATVSGSAAPVLTYNAINGQPAVRFDGVDDHLVLNGGFADFTSGLSVYIVARPTAVRSGSKLLMLGNGAGQQNIGFGRAGGGAGLQYFVDGSGGVRWFNTNNALVTGEAALFSVVQGGGAANAGTTATVEKNGTSVGSGASWVPPVVTRATNYIGRSYWADGLFQGDIAEILIYDRVLTAEEQATVKEYVAQKYGLSVQ
jgi:hypothetical protein